MAASWPSTLAVAWPMPTEPRIWVRTHSSSSTSPGTTWRLKRAFLMSAEQGDAAFVLLFAQKDDGAHLGHGLDDENAGHHRFLGKVALEKGFIAADTFAATARTPGSRWVIRSTRRKGSGGAEFL